MRRSPTRAIIVTLFVMIFIAACGRFGFAPPTDAPAALDSNGETDASTDDSVDSMAPDGGLAPRLVFATVETFLGNVGPLAQLDTQCTADANGAGYVGSFRVVLATVGTDPATRITLGQGRTIQRVDGVVVATDATFFTTSHSATLDVDVTGATISISTAVWTNFSGDGIAQTNDCTGWSDTSATNFGGTGALTAIDATWADAGTARCNRVAHLLCIEQ